MLGWLASFERDELVRTGSEVRKASFAEVASANRYCRPYVNEGTSSGQVADFVSNDVVLNEEPPQQQHERNISAADSACCHSQIFCSRGSCRGIVDRIRSWGL